MRTIVLIFVLLTLLLSGDAMGVSDPSGDCHGEQLGAVTLEGCKGHFCEDPEVRAKYLRVAENGLRGKLTPLLVSSMGTRLESLRRFYRVDPRCEKEVDGTVNVAFRVFPRSMIRNLIIDGNVQVYTEEIRKRIFLRPGVLLALDQPEGESEVRRQEQTLTNYYERGGYMNPQAKVTFQKAGPDQVDCKIVIQEGQRRRIEEVDIRYIRELLDSTAVDADLDPEWQCPRFSARMLEKASGVNEVEVHTERTERTLKTNLTEFLQKHGVKDPKISANFEESTGLLSMDIRYDYCHRIQFMVRSDHGPGESGFRFQEPDDWRDILSFGTSGTYDFNEAEYSRRLLESHLENEGFLFSEIRLDYREIDGRRGGAGRVGTPVSGISTFMVTEGYITEIRALEFEGMSHFQPDNVREQLETQKYDFFGEGGYLQVQKFFVELKDLQERYRADGFHQHRYQGFKATKGEYLRTRERKGPVDVFTFVSGGIGFTANKPRGENVIYIKVQMNEGPRSHLKRLTVEGCGSTCTELRAAINWEDGAPYSRTLLKNALRGAQNFYEGSGYPTVGFELACLAKDEEGRETQCDPETVVAEEVSLKLSVTPGPRVKVGEVFTSGNFRTRTPILIRDISTQGEYLSLAAVRESERKLRNLGVFNTVKVLPMGLDDKGNVTQVPILVEVEESSSQFLDFAIGFESLNRVDLSSAETGKMPPPVSSVVSNGVEVEDRSKGNVGNPVPLNVPDLLLVFQTEYLNSNLFGNAQEFRFPIKYGVSTTDPLRVLAGAPTWIERRFLGTELVFRQTLYGLYDKARNPFDLVEVGSQSEVSTSLAENLYLSAKYNLSGSAVRELDVEEPKFGSPVLINKLSPTLSWQKLDALTHPTEGFGASVTTSYIHSIDLDNSDASNYLKWLFSMKGFVNARGRIVLANFVRFGGAYSIEGNPLPEVERFRLGGAKGVRGFEDGEIAQYNKDGSLRDGDPTTPEVERIDGGDYTLSGTSELRFPFMVELGPLELWGATFFDWGGLAEEITDFHERSFRASGGLGIRLLLYGRVPIRLDYGVKVSPRCKVFAEDQETCIEKESPGELDFNLLYTF